MIDAGSNVVTGVVEVGNDPLWVAVAPDGKNAYVTNEFSNNVAIIATDTSAVVATVPNLRRPTVIAVAPEHCGAGNKERIPDDGQKPERRADPPLHVSSLSWPTHSARWTRRPAAGLPFVVNRYQPHDL